MLLRTDSSEGSSPREEEIGDREKSLEEIMNATKEKLDFLEKDLNKSSTESITNLFLDLFDSGLGEDGGHDWFARSTELLDEFKTLHRKVVEVEERNQSLSLLNIDLLRRNFLLENRIKRGRENSGSAVAAGSENDDNYDASEFGANFDTVYGASNDKYPSQVEGTELSFSHHKLCEQCHQIIYPLDRYANLHLENNQLKYQLIHIESHKLSLEFRIILLKQEICKLKESAKSRSELESKMISLIEDSIVSSKNNDENTFASGYSISSSASHANIAGCNANAPQSVLVTSQGDVGNPCAEQENTTMPSKADGNIRNPKEDKSELAEYNISKDCDQDLDVSLDDTIKTTICKSEDLPEDEQPDQQESTHQAEIKKLKHKIDKLKRSKSALKLKTRELLTEYRRKRENLQQREDEVKLHKLSLMKLHTLHIHLQRSHAEIMENIRTELKSLALVVHRIHKMKPVLSLNQESRHLMKSPSDKLGVKISSLADVDGTEDKTAAFNIAEDVSYTYVDNTDDTLAQLNNHSLADNDKKTGDPKDAADCQDFGDKISSWNVQNLIGLMKTMLGHHSKRNSRLMSQEKMLNKSVDDDLQNDFHHTSMDQNIFANRQRKDDLVTRNGISEEKKLEPPQSSYTAKNLTNSLKGH
eukprot:TRINITY_DN2506_c0_g1_i5.p1 TRINITY_DN2506_c0_g1~~TRINITY_DN2506_c0_g1_i5.p1  ORF type:complete len:644 (+),score=172.45 TRINITY_DN2506_c0_g1_i5:106-2037(+)